ncbi:hypothetical protein [Streptomyces europaeiscabiei]|uniref:hypothetical protein n=1 Tax=Streptomyces europaeiscabiei TaxID=146819 RepID=UPI0029AA39C6|nr:hypothetical protein [Streptomyces europaeiscabiei]MDX3588720.1 hypothetical protein [Streptomyces europaeiscabiei]
MALFGCAGCGAVLTAPVSRVALPIHLSDTHWETLHPPLLEAGTYAIDPEPYGPPWRPWEEIGAQQAAARGIFAPFSHLPDGPSDTVLLAPGDMRATGLITERTEGYCMGINGSGGPNLACLDCGLPVGSRIDDCGQWQAVRLLPHTVVRLPGPPERPVMDWAELPADGALRHRLSEYRDIPAGVALAHVVAAAEGQPVDAAPGAVAELLGPALTVLLPTGEHAKRLALAGPGIGEPAADLVLVPVHPQTGQTWQPNSGAVPVPVEATLWAELAFPPHRTRLPAAGRLPAGVERDDPLPPHPQSRFRPSRDAFRHTLARIPAVREPWLQAIHARGY